MTAETYPDPKDYVTELRRSHTKQSVLYGVIVCVLILLAMWLLPGPKVAPVNEAPVLNPPKAPLRRTDPNDMSRFFYAEDFEVIRLAAKRNGCEGDDFVWLLAIYKAENGRPGREFGIMHPRAIDTCLDVQAGWSAATVVNTRNRWNTEFVEHLAERYAPVGVCNDPDGLNKNWPGNVKFWYDTLKGN